MKLAKINQIAYFFSKKMANYASRPQHPPTTNLWKYSDGFTPNKLKISSWNVNGIRSIIKKQALQNYLKAQMPDIMCINETKIDLSNFNKHQEVLSALEGYEQYWNFCKISSGYSGVAIFSKYKPLKAFQDFQCGYLSLEGRCLTLQYDKFYLVNCYKPNSGANLERLDVRTQIYDRSFLKYVNQLKQRKQVIIVGDMNVAYKQIDLALPKANTKNAGFTKQQRQQFSKFLDHGFIDTFRYLYPQQIKYTWWSARAKARQRNIGWRIDYILSSSQKILRDSLIRDQVLGSDHCPIEGIFSWQ